MAESLAIKNGGGSGLNSETLLWTNPDPGASFAETLVTLSQSLTGFKAVKIVYKYSQTDTTEYELRYLIPEDIESYVKGTNKGLYCIGVLGSAGRYYRPFIFESTALTGIRFYQGNRGGYTDAYNTTNVPLEIYGIK